MSQAANAAPRFCLTGSAAALDVLARAGAELADPAIAALVVEPAADAYGSALLESLHLLADRHDLAFLLADDEAMAALVSADGVEIDWSGEAYARARGALGPERTVGCRAGLSRDDAMQAAEAGADYVALGAPGQSEQDMAALINMVDWWSRVIVVPCLVHGASGRDDVVRLAEAGADFIAVPADIPSARAGDLAGLIAAVRRGQT